jgi:flagellar biosynthesis/type III secretory pathway protein FliH
MSAYSATLLNELDVRPFDFGRQRDQNGPRPWTPAPNGPVLSAQSPSTEPVSEELVAQNSWEDREAQLVSEVESAFERGRTEGFEERELQISELNERLADSVQRFNTILQELTNSLRTDAVALASNLAKAALRDGEMLSPESMERLLSQVLNTVPIERDITVRCNPADFEQLETRLPAIERQQGHGISLRLVEDANIERGGIIVNHSAGSVDAQPSTAIDVLAEAAQSELGNIPTTTINEENNA